MQRPFDDASDEPLYNIGIVSRMTGIAIATLRAWERRYGFPVSARTAGGHRLCSEREIIRLRWVKARLDAGMQTAQAIHALQHLEEAGRIGEMLVAPTMPLSISPSSMEAFEKRLTQLLIDADLPAADQFLSELLATCSVEELILDVIEPTLYAIGEAWTEGRISIAGEHLATSFLRQRVLQWMNTGPVPFVGVPPVLLACAPNEWHEGSLMMFGALMRRRHWPIAYLGQNMPLNDLAEFVRDGQTPAVVLVAMREESAQNLLRLTEFFPELQHNRPLVGYGGRIFTDNPEWRERVPGIFLGETIREGIIKLDGLLRQQFSLSI